MDILTIISEYRVAFIKGLIVTVELFIAASVCGLVVGTLLGVLGSRWKIRIGLPSRLMSFVLSGVPILVFLFWVHYPLQAYLGVVIDPFFSGAATLAIINIFAVADIFRESLNNFPSQYILAARVCGIESKDIAWHIQIPIILRQVIPELLRVEVMILQSTLFASLISVEELFRVAQRINANIYRPVEIYTGLAIFFLLICLPINGLAIWLKMKFTRDISERG